MMPLGIVPNTNRRRYCHPKLPRLGVRFPRKPRKYRNSKYGRRDAWKNMPARFCPWSAKERRFDEDDAERASAAAAAEASVDGTSATSSVIMEVATVPALPDVSCCSRTIGEADLLPTSGEGGANANDLGAAMTTVAASAATADSLAMVDVFDSLMSCVISYVSASSF